MKPKTNLDPMFQADLRRRWPICSIGALLIVLALGGLALRAGPIPMRRQVSPPFWVAPVPGERNALQGGAANSRAGNRLPRDRFVIAAPAELDRAMVVRARDDIDPEMVFNPDIRRRGLATGGPAPVTVAPAPGAAPLPVPSLDHARPRR